jgi:peroxiredoxin
MQDVDTFTVLTATFFSVVFTAWWARALVRVEFDRWLGLLRTLAPLPLALSLTALLRSDIGWVTALALVNMIPSAAFLAVQTFSGQPKRKIAVRVGQPIVDFEARDHHGQRFASTALQGKRYLLKFYRGHWCPYCRLELSAWNEMGNELEQRGIDFVAISPDTPSEVAAFTASNPHLKMRFLSDEGLQVIDQFNLRSYKTLAVGKGRSLTRPLAIPTTLLVDERGIVRWIDQSDDHQVRSNPRRVLPALDDALGIVPAPTASPVEANSSSKSLDPQTPCADCS